MAFVTFQIDDDDNKLRDAAKATAKAQGSSVSEILRQTFMALAQGDEVDGEPAQPETLRELEPTAKVLAHASGVWYCDGCNRELAADRATPQRLKNPCGGRGCRGRFIQA